MAIITKPSVEKGMPAQYSINKAELAAAITDPYWSEPANWKQAVLVYKSVEGKQRPKTFFDMTQENPVADFSLSLRARDVFEVEGLILFDFDNGGYPVPLTILENEGLGIDLSGPSAFLVREFNSLSGLNEHEDVHEYYITQGWFALDGVKANFNLPDGRMEQITYSHELLSPLTAGKKYKLRLYDYSFAQSPLSYQPPSEHRIMSIGGKGFGAVGVEGDGYTEFTTISTMTTPSNNKLNIILSYASDGFNNYGGSLSFSKIEVYEVDPE